MPVVKETSDRLVRFGYQFEVYPRHVIQRIKNPDALAYYVYLLSMPDEWAVRRSHLMDHFGLGRHRHDKAMKVLNDLGLAWVQVERGDDGRIVDRKLMIGAIPVDELPSPKVGKSTVRKNPQSGKSDHLDIDTVIRDIDKLSNSNKLPFDDFYKQYPRKVGKAQAERAWRRLSGRDQAVAVEDIASRTWPDDKKYIPHPATYLNARRWEDEKEEAQTEESYF